MGKAWNTSGAVKGLSGDVRPAGSSGQPTPACVPQALIRRIDHTCVIKRLGALPGLLPGLAPVAAPGDDCALQPIESPPTGRAGNA